jgi:hypothetical protein
MDLDVEGRVSELHSVLFEASSSLSSVDAPVSHEVLLPFSKERTKSHADTYTLSLHRTNYAASSSHYGSTKKVMCIYYIRWITSS